MLDGFWVPWLDVSMTSTCLTEEEAIDIWRSRTTNRNLRSTVYGVIAACGIEDPIEWFVGRTCNELIRAIAAGKAHANDGVVCDRCGGHGGADCWPGWTCYECGGKGWT